MRTTLDIDDDVLRAAKDLARRQKKTAGAVISALARMGLNKDAAILGMALFHASPAQLAGIHAALVEGLRNGTLRPVIAREFPLAEAPRSHEAVMEAGHHGKIVLIP